MTSYLPQKDSTNRRVPGCKVDRTGKGREHKSAQNWGWSRRQTHQSRAVASIRAVVSIRAACEGAREAVEVEGISRTSDQLGKLTMANAKKKNTVELIKTQSIKSHESTSDTNE